MKFRKKIISVIIVGAMCSSCGSINATKPSNNFESDSMVTPASTTIYNYYSYRGFSDNVAWVRDRHHGGWMCIDSNGNVLFVMNGVPYTDFQRGIAIIEENGEKKVIDKTGTVISAPEDGKYTSIINSQYNFDGYVFVEHRTKSVTGTVVLTNGIIDNNGEWLLEPVSSELVSDYTFKSIGYGLYVLDQRGIDYYGSPFYDAENNVFISNSEAREIYWDRRYNDTSEGLIYFNDYETQETLWNRTCQNGLPDEDDSHTHKTGFYDRNEKLVIDMSQYASVDILGDFYDGYCALYITNKQGDRFLAFIDTNGNFSYEPEELPKWEYVGSYSGGLLKRQEKQYDYNHHYFIDYTGNVVISVEQLENTKAKILNYADHTVIHYNEVSDFNEYGIATIGNEDGGFCFIDKTGNIAF